MRFVQSITALTSALVALNTQAYEATLTAGSTSLMPGVVTETFQAAPVFTQTGDGEIFNSNSPGAALTADGIYLIYHVSAQPKKESVSPNDKWFSLGAHESATFTLSGGASYVGLLWGSSDAYNTVSFYDRSNNLIASYIGGDGGLAANQVPSGVGTQGSSAYLNFSAPSIGSVKLEASHAALELDNFSVMMAVPEPGSAALMLAGIGALGFIASRRTATSRRSFHAN